jgi:tetratricopeptide (TPR) repeat protein
MLALHDRRVRALVIAVLVLMISAAIYWGWASYRYERHRQAALAALERYDFDEAGLHLQTCLAIRPNDPHMLLLAAQTARRAGNVDDVYPLLRRAEQHGADRNSIDLERQLLTVQRGDLNDIDELIETCAQDPAGSKALLILEAIIEGSVQERNAELADKYVAFWLKHRHAGIEQAQGLLLRGWANLAFDKTVPLPRDDFQKAVELAPELHRARLWLVMGLIGEEPGKAVEHLEWLKAHRPDDPAVRFQVARYYRSVGRPEEAADIFDELIERSPPNRLAALVERSRVELDLNRPREAEKFARRAMAIASEHREVMIVLADCLRLQPGREAEANAYQKIIQERDEHQAKMAAQGKADKTKHAPQ